MIRKKQLVGLMLIEVIIGLAAGALVMTAAAVTYGAFVSGMNRDKQILNARTDLSYLFDSLSTDLQNTGQQIEATKRTKGSIMITGAQSSGDRKCIVLNWTEKQNGTAVEKFKAYRYIVENDKGRIEAVDSPNISRAITTQKINYPQVCNDSVGSWKPMTASNLNIKTFKLCRLRTDDYNLALDQFSNHISADGSNFSQAVNSIDDKTKPCLLDTSSASISNENYIEYPEKYVALYVNGAIQMGSTTSIPVSRMKVVGLYYSPILRFFQ